MWIPLIWSYEHYYFQHESKIKNLIICKKCTNPDWESMKSIKVCVFVTKFTIMIWSDMPQQILYAQIKLIQGLCLYCFHSANNFKGHLEFVKEICSFLSSVW